MTGQLRQRHIAMIAIGGVIGAGLFVGSSAAIERAGPAVLFAYILAGAQTLCIMRMLGEMALGEKIARTGPVTADRPGHSSFIGQIRRGLGDHAGFISGWSYWLLWTIIAGAESIAGTGLLAPWIRLPGPTMELLLIGLMTLTNAFSVRGYGEFEYWLSTLKIVALIAFAGFGVAALLGLFGPGQAAGFSGHEGLAPHGFLAVIAVIPVVMMSLGGSEIATVAALDSADPVANVARAARSVPLRVLLFYIVSVALILAIVPWADIHSGTSPFVTALDRLHVPFASTSMTAVMFVAVMSCLNSAIYATSRLMTEMAAHGDAPAFLGKRQPNGVPLRAVLAAALIEIIIALASTASPGLIFAFLLSCSGALILFEYLLAAIAQIRLRYQHEREGQQLAYRMWCFPALSYATAASIVLVLFIMIFTPETLSELIFSSGTVLVILLVSLLRKMFFSKPHITLHHPAD